MATLCDQLQNWIVENMTPLTDSRLERIPISKLNILTDGKKRRIWKYVVEHVRGKNEAQRIRRILEIRRSKKELEKLFPSPAVDTQSICQEIKRETDKRIFIQNSLKKDKSEIYKAEKSLVLLEKEISMVYQRIALLDVLSERFSEKTVHMNALLSELKSHLGIGFTRESVEAFMPKQTNKKKLASESDKELNHLLLHTKSTILKKLDIINSTEYTVDSLMKKMNRVMKVVFLTELISSLSDQSKKSRFNAMISGNNSETYIIDENSQHCKYHLQSMKSNNIHISFRIKKNRSEVVRNSESSDLEYAKITSTLNSSNPDYDLQCNILKTLAENKGLEQSIQYLDDILSHLQNEEKQLKKENISKSHICQEIEGVVVKFYKQYDAAQALLKIAPDAFHSILHSFNNLHVFANTEAFVGLTDSMRNSPSIISDDMSSVIDSTWKVVEKNGIINPIIDSSCVDPNTPSHFYKVADIPRYQDFSLLCRRVFGIKQYVQRKESFEINSDELDRTFTKIENLPERSLIQHVEKRVDILNSCEEVFSEMSTVRKKLDLVLNNWWNQPAQDVPYIEHMGKTLKMWRDILFVLPDF